MEAKKTEFETEKGVLTVLLFLNEGTDSRLG